MIDTQQIPQVVDSECFSIFIVKWYGYTKIIEEQNKKLDQLAADVVLIFDDGNFRSYLLKGQGVA